MGNILPTKHIQKYQVPRFESDDKKMVKYKWLTININQIGDWN